MSLWPVPSVLSPAVRRQLCGAFMRLLKTPLFVQCGPRSPQYPHQRSPQVAARKAGSLHVWSEPFTLREKLGVGGSSLILPHCPGGGMGHWLYGKAGTWIYCWSESGRESDRPWFQLAPRGPSPG